MMDGGSMPDAERHFPRGITVEQIEETRVTFQPYYKETLTDDDCLEMLLNVYGLFDIFDEIDERLAREALDRQAKSRDRIEGAV
jgi:hypothetical protein